MRSRNVIPVASLGAPQIDHARVIGFGASAGGVGGASARDSNMRSIRQAEFLDGLAEIIAQAILADQGG